MKITPVIELSRVSKSYRRGGFFRKGERVEVLKEIDLSIRPGECVGLIGPSGSGKSTMGRILLGLESPDDGEVRMMGESISAETHLSKNRRRAVQVVFQNAPDSCNPRMTAREILSEPLRNFEKLKGRRLEEKIDSLLKKVGLLSSDKGKRPDRFSGGELQRICIARALAPGPDLILLDEAVSALDMVVQSQILDLLDELRFDLGTAYLFVTHDLRLVRRFCDRAFLLENGRLEPFDPATFAANKHLPLLDELVKAMPPSRPNRNRG